MSPVRERSTRNLASSAAALVLAWSFAACGGAGDATSPGGSRFDAERAFRDLRAQVAIGPRPAGSAASRREARFIVGRLRAAGVSDVTAQHPHLNVVGRIPGREPGAIVLAAHHDTARISGFVGANDGASGVAVVLELARALPPRVDGRSVYLALFDAEEAPPDSSFADRGARGARQFVRYAREGGRQGTPPLRRIRALVLFDMVGDCDLTIPREANSDPDLYEALAAAGSPFGGEAAGILDDHIPFAEAGIPAVDVIDFEYGPGPSPGDWWHTRRDDLSRVCAQSLGAVGSATLAALPQIP